MALETARLVVRRPEISDAPEVAALWSDPNVTRFLGGPRDFETVRKTVVDEARASTSQSTGFWRIVEKASGRAVGDCGLVEKDVDGRSEIELVYVLAPGSWGKGYATEAASAMRDYALHQLRLGRLIALIDPANAASARVAGKIGMRFEKETLRPGGRVVHVYAMETQAAKTWIPPRDTVYAQEPGSPGCLGRLCPEATRAW
jgi:RimJ/RimL family protein N-acetyltransferase